MATDQEIQQLENFCKDVYETTDSLKRVEAEKILSNFQNSSDSLVKCRILLERGSSSYSQLLAATTLIKLVSRPVQIISLQERLQIKNYVLSYLANRGKLDTFVIQNLASLYGRVTKSGWFDMENDEFVFRKVVADVGVFLQGPVELCTIGIQLLSVLTNQMNEYYDTSTNICLSRQRKTAASFKSEELLAIFSVCHASIKMALEKRATLNFDDELQLALMSQLLQLAINCFTVQSNWKGEFLDFKMYQPFFEIYYILPPALSRMALTCMVEIAEIGKCCNVEDVKKKFLTQLLAGIKLILQNLHGLNDPTNYHEFCQLIAAIKANYQLSGLVDVEGYAETIQLLTTFTVNSLTQMLEIAPNGVHFLMSFWQGMAASMPHASSQPKPHYLGACIPRVTGAYVTARMESIAAHLRDGVEDPLDDVALVEQEMEHLSGIGRIEYQATCGFIAGFYDTTARSYQELIQRGNFAPADAVVLEGKLSWLVHMISALIAGRCCYSENEVQDGVDGELISRVIQLMQITDNRLTQGQGGCEHLEIAYIEFSNKVKKSFMGDMAKKSEKIYKKLAELIGIADEGTIFALFIRKAITNLKYWSHSEDIVEKTLLGLNALSIANNGSMRKQTKSDEIQFLMNNHAGDYFPFLGLNKNLKKLKLRVPFYAALGRFVMIEALDDKSRFDAFMAPFTTTMEMIGQTLSNSETTLFQSEETKWSIIGLACDLRGIVSALPTRPPYLMFFDWIYPKYIPIFERAMQLWFHDPNMTTPVLNLFVELVQNRSERLQFGDFSPNSVLLFREISKMICTYGSRIATVTDIPAEQLYPMKLKGICLCFKMLRNVFFARFVNFGVMRLYCDESLDNVLNCYIKFVVSITNKDLMQNPKLSVAYYTLLRNVTQDHMDFLTTIDPNIFIYILMSVSEGIAGLDTTICTESSTTVDYIVTYLFGLKEKRAELAGSENKWRFLHAVEANPDILKEILAFVLNVLLFEDCKNQWSMTRPLLGLILLNEEHFTQLRDETIRSQPIDKQAVFSEWFTALMVLVERNLSMRNKDRFTLNLIHLRRNING